MASPAPAYEGLDRRGPFPEPQGQLGAHCGLRLSESQFPQCPHTRGGTFLRQLAWTAAPASRHTWTSNGALGLRRRQGVTSLEEPRPCHNQLLASRRLTEVSWSPGPPHPGPHCQQSAGDSGPQSGCRRTAMDRQGKRREHGCVPGRQTRPLGLRDWRGHVLPEDRTPPGQALCSAEDEALEDDSPWL